jgi:hypothetical protein
MTNYQIKIPDGHLTDLVHEITIGVVSRSVVTAAAIEPGAKIPSAQLYPSVFETCKSVLKRYVRGFHVCGCRPHCDRESQGTELGKPAVLTRNSTVARYVLSLEVPLKDFAKELEAELVKSVSRLIQLHNWHKLLFPVVREVVEPILGKYLSYSPTCNRGEYLCTVGACTEFDPWEDIQPRAL